MKRRNTMKPAALFCFLAAAVSLVCRPTSSAFSLVVVPQIARNQQTQHRIYDPFIANYATALHSVSSPQLMHEKTSNSKHQKGGEEKEQISTSSPKSKLSPVEAAIRKVTMISYIASMCVALPVALFPLWLLSKTTIADRWINTAQRETMALDVGQWCARSLLVIMPFMEVSVQSDVVDGSRPSSSPPEPSIWVCNHTSMLDTFILLACDQQLRGPHKRPIKTIYWKGLEDNPICNLLFKMAGFIPVQMEANASGDANQYDKKSFVRLLRDSKRAFGQGFDLLILPEGQLNPWPQKGLLPVFPGAHKLSQMSGRPIRMVALHGCHNLWPANDSILDMTLKDKSVKVRAYHGAGAGENGGGRMFESGEEFVDTFRAVVGQFGATGEDLPSEELAQWFDGSKWKEEQEQQRKNNEKYCHHQQENSIVQEAVKQEISRVLAREEYDANEQPPTGSPTSRRQASHDEPMSRPHP